MAHEMLETAGKQVLVNLVKKVQQKGLKGTHGGWKEFLNVHDKKFGCSMSDPNKRSTNDLIAFLKTITNKDDLNFMERVLQCHINIDIVEQNMKKTPDNESIGPDKDYERAQALVRLTLQHPQYPVEYSFPSHEEGWVVMKLKKKYKVTRSPEMVAVDCEMVLCEDGTEALVKVCVVGRDLKVKLDKLVKPDKAIADYRTEITGITPEQLEGETCSLEDVQKSMKKILSHGTILIGHSLHNDLQALKIDFARVIDTSFVFKYSGGSSNRRPSLNNLCKAALGYEVRQKGRPHNCLDDAIAAMKLLLRRIEPGVDGNIDFGPEEVLDVEMSKLLVHRIPATVHYTDLHNIISGKFTIELKPPKKEKAGKPEHYSAIAKFDSPQAASQAFESIEGIAEKDTSGRPQKLVTFQLKSGVMGTLYARKMASDDARVVPSKKRALQGEEDSGKSKKQKADAQIEVKTPNKSNESPKESDETMEGEPKECEEHKKVIEEQAQKIESMKDELRRKDLEIKTLNTIVANLRKKR